MCSGIQRDNLLWESPSDSRSVEYRPGAQQRWLENLYVRFWDIYAAGFLQDEHRPVHQWKDTFWDKASIWGHFPQKLAEAKEMVIPLQDGKQCLYSSIWLKSLYTTTLGAMIAGQNCIQHLIPKVGSGDSALLSLLQSKTRALAYTYPYNFLIMLIPPKPPFTQIRP